MPSMRACFVRASGQNVYFEEITEALRSALQRQGTPTEIAVDNFPSPSPELVYVFVPHEYMALTYPRAHPTDAQLRRTVVLATEQPGTSWFEETAAIASRAGATVELNELGALELRRRGVGVRPIRLGYVPEWDHWHGEAAQRPIDVTFLGGYTRRRGRALASCGHALHRHRSAIHLADNAYPQTAASAAFLSGERKYRHLASTKLLLNIHRKKYAYLEWIRVLEAIANGCVVLTEHACGFAPLRAGEHFVSVSVENLPYVLEELLEDEQRLQTIRESAYEFVRAELPIESSAIVLAEAISAASANAARSDALTRPSAPAPKPPPGPRPVWERIEDEPFEWRQLRSAVKRVALDQRRLERRIAEMMSTNGKDEVAVERYGPAREDDARVSVVLTVFNYEHLVEEAIASVGLAAGDETELVVVDDASTDDSAGAVFRALTERSPWLRTTFLRRRRNGGLPAARNLAIEHATGEYVFVLDADNVVYPNAFPRLAAALDGDPDAAFAYGILEKFDGSGPVDLMSWEAWSRERFKYGNYIDAMSMLRRSAFDRVGGFPTDERLYGWEDFALWCAFAESDQYGAFVPEIVGRYRAGPLSMITVTEIDTSEAWATLTELYPFLREPDEVA